ncbi:MAG: carboxypeptidase regulatory-like domain-containing protein [Acidobacteria bacterium]|nr:carboxypeptidase regulatory-like domain-containing protein [Acidobacteriota bacterium]MCA1643222.1 carboxypeptidase regulatory-like domain-containing protein [Acidobacteriota bacterium]
MSTTPLRSTACALLLALFCFAFGVGTASAQSEAASGQISGTIKDSTGAAVPNATVTVTNKENGSTRTATTNDDGIYTIVQLQPGTYTVSAQAGSFAETKLENLVVNVGRVAVGDITLGVGGVQESVTVSAEGIQVTRNESDAVLNETAITNLPINGRRFQDFITLTPSAQVDPQRGQISLSGQKGINSNINVDGVDYNQPFFGGIRGGERANLAFTIPQESIKEFQVVASGYSAEFGRSTGGIVNAVTKSGDNRVRGSAFYLLRPQRLARGNEFTEALQEQRLSAAGVNASLAPTQHQFGGSIGGPIKENKLFYFGAYEQQRFRAPRQIVFGIPSTFPGTLTLTAGQQEVLNFYKAEQVGYQLSNDAYAGLARIDWNVNNAHRFNVRFSASKNNALNAVSRGETSLDPTTTQALSTNGTEKNKTRIGVAQLVSSFGSSAVNELRLQAAREDRPRISNSELPQILTSFATFGATNFLPTTQYDKRYQVADSFTYLTGNHNIKFGGEFSHLFANQRFGFNQFGGYALSIGSTAANISDALLRLANTTTIIPPTSGLTPTVILGRFDDTRARYNRQIGNLAAEFAAKELAFFAQDNWRVTPKLSLNFGLRAEQQYNPEPDVSNTQIANVVKNTVFPIRGKGYTPSIPDSGWQFGPRVGFAYDPEGKGKMVLRGFAGYYYARTPLLVLADSTNNYRIPPANVSTTLPFTGFSQSAFNTFLASAAGTPYKTITGCNPAAAANTPALLACTPNSVFRQFAIIGINLNASPLNNLPIISPDQISSIASGLGLNPNPFVGAQVTGHAEDFKNPRSFQFGFAFEREVARNLTVGIDYAHVKTDRVQRNRDLNLPAPLTAEQYISFLQASNTAANFNALVTNGTIDQIRQSGRSYIAINTPAGLPTAPSGTVFTRQRPTQAQQGFALGSVQVRESTAKSLYRGLTFRTRWSHRRAQVNAYYTFSRLLADDDNERDAGGIAYADPYDLRGEYYRSRLDRENQFVANPIFFLPYNFEISSAIRLRSGNPINPTSGADLNGDGVNNDRPLQVPGITYPRNYFRNRSIYDVDLRVQKGFRLGENRRLTLSSEFFNVLNRSNIIFPSPNTATSSGQSGQFCSAASQLCGLSGVTNPNFLRVTDPVTGAILVNNTNPGSQVFQMQVGVRLQF